MIFLGDKNGFKSRVESGFGMELTILDALESPLRVEPIQRDINILQTQPNLTCGTVELKLSRNHQKVGTLLTKKMPKRKKKRTHIVEDEKAGSNLASGAPSPRSMVVRLGSTKTAEEPELSMLISDVRQLMSPATALKLKERKGAKIRDYAEMGPALGVTHLLAFSMNEGGNVNCKVARLPAGPTLTFKVKRFSLSKHIRAIQRRPIDSSSGIFKSPPVVVTNNFGAGEAAAHVKLMRITFQNMFPAVDVGTVRLSDIRRVVLFNLLKVRREDGAKWAAVASRRAL